MYTLEHLETATNALPLELTKTRAQPVSRNPNPNRDSLAPHMRDRHYGAFCEMTESTEYVLHHGFRLAPVAPR